jgi:hypothetical protein
MRIARRCLVLIALMFWQGGFTFYASVVVPIGTEVLDSVFEQGRITRQVTWYINLTAAIALLPLALDVFASCDPSRLRRLGRLALLLFMALCQVVLFVLRARLAGLLDDISSFDELAFRPLHRLYLWTHAVQWGAGLLFLPLMVLSWQVEDSGEVGVEKKEKDE